RRHLYASKLPVLRSRQEPVRLKEGRLPGGRCDGELGRAHADLARERAPHLSPDLYRGLLHRGLRRAVLTRTCRKARPDALLIAEKLGIQRGFSHLSSPTLWRGHAHQLKPHDAPAKGQARRETGPRSDEQKC